MNVFFTNSISLFSKQTADFSGLNCHQGQEADVYQKLNEANKRVCMLMGRGTGEGEGFTVHLIQKKPLTKI